MTRPTYGEVISTATEMYLKQTYLDEVDNWLLENTMSNKELREFLRPLQDKPDEYIAERVEEIKDRLRERGVAICENGREVRGIGDISGIRLICKPDLTEEDIEIGYFGDRLINVHTHTIGPAVPSPYDLDSFEIHHVVGECVMRKSDGKARGVCIIRKGWPSLDEMKKLTELSLRTLKVAEKESRDSPRFCMFVTIGERRYVHCEPIFDENGLRKAEEWFVSEVNKVLGDKIKAFIYESEL